MLNYENTNSFKKHINTLQAQYCYYLRLTKLDAKGFIFNTFEFTCVIFQVNNDEQYFFNHGPPYTMNLLAWLWRFLSFLQARSDCTKATKIHEIRKNCHGASHW